MLRRHCQRIQGVLHRLHLPVRHPQLPQRPNSLRHPRPEHRDPQYQEQRSSEPSPPRQRIPTQQDEGRGGDPYQDEEPVTSYHNLREQDEEENFEDNQRRTFLILHFAVMQNSGTTIREM